MEEQKFVGFRLGDQKFGLEINNVSGIMNFEGVTQVPNSPSYVEGLINVGGNNIPVINLRKKFGCSDTYAPHSQIILYRQYGKNIGLLVDEALFHKETIERPSVSLRSEMLRYIKGFGKIDGEVMLVLDIDRLSIPQENEIIHLVKQQCV